MIGLGYRTKRITTILSPDFSHFSRCPAHALTGNFGFEGFYLVETDLPSFEVSPPVLPFCVATYRLTPPKTTSNRSLHLSMSATADFLSSSALLSSPSSTRIRVSCSVSLFSTPGSTPIKYSICRALIRRSCASSCWADANVRGLSGPLSALDGG